MTMMPLGSTLIIAAGQVTTPVLEPHRWRRIKISAIRHVSSRRDSPSHVAVRVIRRKTNRRHMTGDHHGQTAGTATLLVRAVDGILGTHRSRAGSCSRHGTCLWTWKMPGRG